MRDLSGDPGVFIRSMASRGALGGLARATADVVKVLDAAGFDAILIETVGAGQSEVDIARAAHTTLVIEAPGLGDDVQAIKAGLLEVADILVVNKADLPGADAAQRALRASLELAHPAARRWTAEADGHHAAAPGAGRAATSAPLAAEAPAAGQAVWVPPIIPTVAVQGQGIEALLAAIDRHQAYLDASGGRAERDRERLAHELETRLRDDLLAAVRRRLGPAALAEALDQVVARALEPGAAARALAERALRDG
jgi:LAO/AO transport system kinase